MVLSFGNFHSRLPLPQPIISRISNPESPLQLFPHFPQLFEIKFLFHVHTFVSYHLFCFVGSLDHHFGHVIVLYHSDSIMGGIFIESLIALRFPPDGPFLPLLGRNNQSIINKLLVIQPPYFLRFERPMRSKLFNRTSKNIQLYPHIIDCK